jgi:hypothetical protein
MGMVEADSRQEVEKHLAAGGSDHWRGWEGRAGQQGEGREQGEQGWRREDRGRRVLRLSRARPHSRGKVNDICKRGDMIGTRYRYILTRPGGALKAFSQV